MIVEPSCAFEPLISASQAASLLNLHPNTLLLWAREGILPFNEADQLFKFSQIQLCGCHRGRIDVVQTNLDNHCWLPNERLAISYLDLNSSWEAIYSVRLHPSV
jgi:hypothetical protein